MKALSIRQPWAWLIINAGKDIENRNWRPAFRGRFLIHAAKGCTRDEYQAACDLVAEINCIKGLAIRVPPLSELERGGIVGVVEAVDCVSAHSSPWFMGSFGLVLRNARRLPFTPYKGQLGFFDVPTSLVQGL